jgi:hypothetical protein
LYGLQDLHRGNRPRQVRTEDSVEEIDQQVTIGLGPQQGLEDAVDLGIDGMAHVGSVGRRRRCDKGRGHGEPRPGERGVRQRFLGEQEIGDRQRYPGRSEIGETRKPDSACPLNRGGMRHLRRPVGGVAVDHAVDVAPGGRQGSMTTALQTLAARRSRAAHEDAGSGRALRPGACFAFCKRPGSFDPSRFAISVLFARCRSRSPPGAILSLCYSMHRVIGTDSA